MDPIVIPTCEGARTVSGLLGRACQNPDLGRLHVLVGDDASPDGTALAVRAHASYGDRVLLLGRGDTQGPGAARPRRRARRRRR